MGFKKLFSILERSFFIISLFVISKGLHSMRGAAELIEKAYELSFYSWFFI
ncbi:predicted protein [Listeria monocytogenes FSL J2-071]|nr:predicted protein [Listeria monocytogenes FSL J2-071]CUM35176.1 Predicted protein [Listeria monocytogenes]